MPSGLQCSMCLLPPLVNIFRWITGHLGYYFNFTIKNTSSLSICTIYTPLERYWNSASYGVCFIKFHEKTTKISWVIYGNFAPNVVCHLIKMLGYYFNFKIKNTSSLSICTIYTPLERFWNSASNGVYLIKFRLKMTKILRVMYDHFFPKNQLLI